MATTVVAAVVERGEASIVNVGDSRAYLVHGGTARQITRDHSLAAEAVRDGDLTQDEARLSNARHVITRSVGGAPELDVDQFGPVALASGACLLLCSDGLYDVVNDDEIARAVAGAAPDAAAGALIELANDRGGPDNISVVIFRQPARDQSEPLESRDASLQPPSRYTIAGITTAANGGSVFHAVAGASDSPRPLAAVPDN
jgi:protein phosphatase